MNDETPKNLRSQLKHFFESNQITEEIILRATEHLSEKTIEGVNEVQPQAIGEFYESLAYEMTLEFASINDDVRFVVAKGTDVSRHSRMYENHEESDGLSYENGAKIVIRGDGRTLGEYDLILFDRLGDIVYCEVKKNKMGFRRPKYKIQYKKKLLENLFGCRVDLLLVYSEVPSDSSENYEIIRGTDGDYSVLELPPQRYLKYILDSKNKENGFKRMTMNPLKICFWDDLETLRKLNYAEDHAQLRNFLISLVRQQEPIDILRKRIKSSLVERIFVGKITEDGTEEFLKSIDFTIEGNELNLRSFREKFSEIILGLSVPMLNPMLYLKTNTQNGYQKTIPDKDGVFIISEKIEMGGGFFNAISQTKEMIPPQLALNILEIVMDGSGLGKTL